MDLETLSSRLLLPASAVVRDAMRSIVKSLLAIKGDKKTGQAPAALKVLAEAVTGRARAPVVIGSAAKHELKAAALPGVVRDAALDAYGALVAEGFLDANAAIVDLLSLLPEIPFGSQMSSFVALLVRLLPLRAATSDSKSAAESDSEHVEVEPAQHVLSVLVRQHPQSLPDVLKAVSALLLR